MEFVTESKTINLVTTKFWGNFGRSFKDEPQIKWTNTHEMVKL